MLSATGWYPYCRPVPRYSLAARRRRMHLAFEQGRRRYSIPCKVRELKPGSASREAAIWHNRLFNPALPDTVHVLEFKPDWTSVKRED